MSETTDYCPCGSGVSYAHCCGRYHAGETPATAEVLMRSRYAAFVLGKVDYLRHTWHPSTRPEPLVVEAAVHWLGLRVCRCTEGAAQDGAGTVEFVARYKVNGKAGRLHEVSHFVQEDGCWYYVDGEFPAPPSKR